ncbi:MAG: hypothetical protein PWQ17_1599 [Anaerophaga sp.]|nr:hypothetical protein [Anaerophaga sp.]MDK2842094.1 hypothetical protein [Anaerophaga sp.]
MFSRFDILRITRRIVFNLSIKLRNFGIFISAADYNGLFDFQILVVRSCKMNAMVLQIRI